MKRFIFVIWLFAISCNTFFPDEPESNTILEGELDDLNETQNAIFLRGDVAFNEVFSPERGLGPVFIANSCGTCHPGDGKGHPSNALFRFGSNASGQFDPLARLGGPQLQHRAIPGFIGEEIPPEATHVTKLIAPANTGLGFLEAIPDDQIVEWSDPNDLDGDGISGRINWVNAPQYLEIEPEAISMNGKYIGRFGKKATAINLLHQTVTAYKQDMGITTEFDPVDLFNPAIGKGTADNVPDPEVSAATVQDVVFYLKTLRAPEGRTGGSDIFDGKVLFEDAGCGACHKSNIMTGRSDVSQLSFQLIDPYTDLLLHDMGPTLDDGIEEGSAESYEWRTPPLWGLGLAGSAQGGQMFLMHDGRASTIREAIMLHGGEAEQSKNNFAAFTQNEQDKLISFLRSL